MARIKLATLWLGGCSGCHISFLDLDEWLFDLAAQVDLVYSPFADIKVYPEGVDVVLVVPVDVYLPGYPPSAHRIRAVLEPLLAGDTPNLSGEQIKFG